MIPMQKTPEKYMPTNFRKCLTISATLALPLMLLAPLAQADVAQRIEDCDACHGANGVSKESDVPTIAGISSFVLEEYMFQYVDKKRPCRESKYRYGDTSRPAKSMCDVAKELSEAEITEIAEYYAGKEFVAADQPFDAALAAEGAKIHKRDCEKCHTDGGSYQDDDAGRLAGQWAAYLEESIEDYKSGKRHMLEEKMQQKIDALDAASVAALVQYYASLK
jgi:sulfide dehydrogenase cytochrome subunit